MKQSGVDMAKMPMVFTFQDAVQGNGFLAGVTMSGRALVEFEDDGRWWMYGVQPGAIAESGGTPPEAHAAFRTLYRTYLFDTAETAPTFDAFREEVTRFFNATDSESEASWEDACAAIENKKVKPEAPFDTLPREPRTARRPLSVSVDRLDAAQPASFRPAQNILDVYALVA